MSSGFFGPIRYIIVYSHDLKQAVMEWCNDGMVQADDLDFGAARSCFHQAACCDCSCSSGTEVHAFCLISKCNVPQECTRNAHVKCSAADEQEFEFTVPGKGQARLSKRRLFDGG